MVVDSLLSLERHACFTNMQASLMYWRLINKLEVHLHSCWYNLLAVLRPNFSQ